MELVIDSSLSRVIVTVRDEKMLSQLMMKKSFKVIKDTGKYIKGLIDYDDLVFDFDQDIIYD